MILSNYETTSGEHATGKYLQVTKHHLNVSNFPKSLFKNCNKFLCFTESVNEINDS